MVAEHAKSFPKGELVAERELVRISALRRQGRNDEARRFATMFTKRFPSHPKTPSLKTFIEAEE